MKKYQNLMYSEFCEISSKHLNLSPIDMGYGDPAQNKEIEQHYLLAYLINELCQKNAGAYSEVEGEKDLINNFKEYIKKDEDIDNYELAVVTGGGRSALTNILRTLINPNESILIPEPMWSGYKSVVDFVHGKIIPLKTSIENNFIPTAKEIYYCLQENPSIKVMILNTPNNPTGAFYSEENIKEILEVLLKYRIYCIADYTYRAISNINLPSVNKIAEELGYSNYLISMQTLGKVTLTPGLRLGFVYSKNKKLIDDFCHRKQATDFSGHVFIQKAFAKYLKTSEQDFISINNEFDKRRKTFIDELSKFGYSKENKNLIVSDSGFYLSFKIPEYYKNKEFNFFDNNYVLYDYDFIDKDYINLLSNKYNDRIPKSEFFVLDLIQKTAVNFLPGHLFCSDNEYKNWVRVALIQDEEKIKEAFERIRKADILKNG